MGHYSREDDSVKLPRHIPFRMTASPPDEAMGETLDDLKGATVSARFYKLKKK